MRAFAHMMHVDSGRSLFVPYSAVPFMISGPDVIAMHAPCLHGGHGHLHADFFHGEAAPSDQHTMECHHTHAPGCRFDYTQDESFVSRLAVTLLESDLFAGLRESGSLSGHDVPQQAQAYSRPARE